MKRAEISIQVMFFIMMAIIFIAIIGYGFSKIIFVSKTISEVEKQDVLSEIEDAFAHCEDPMAKGDKKTIKVRNKGFNSICILPSNSGNSVFNDIFNKYNLSLNQEISGKFFSSVDSLAQSGENVMLFDTRFYDNGNTHVVSEFNVIDSFKIEYETEVFCDFDLENKGELSFELVCN